MPRALVPSFWRTVFRPLPKRKRMADLRAEVKKRVQSEAQFLAGRHGRISEFLRLIRIMLEFIRGFRALHFIGPAITVFGSARFKEGHPYYDLSREIGRRLAREGYTVITGGGPGLMEAANRGAQEIGGKSVGVNVILPHEQAPNRFLDRVVTFYYFFVRKVMLVKYSYAFVFLPGGFGTLDEMTEAMTLIQTGKIYEFPVILVGKEYWRGFSDFIENTLVKNKAVNPHDLTFLHVTDDPAEVLRVIDQAVEGLGLRLQPISSHAD